MQPTTIDEEPCDAKPDAARKEDIGGRGFLYIFFSPTKTGQAKGAQFLERFTRRTEDRDTRSMLTTREAQYEAIDEWGVPDHNKLQRMAGVHQPTLAANGEDDLIIPTRLTHLLAGLMPNAQVRIYPAAAHRILCQYSVEFGGDVNTFLAA